MFDESLESPGCIKNRVVVGALPEVHKKIQPLKEYRVLGVGLVLQVSSLLLLHTGLLFPLRPTRRRRHRDQGLREDSLRDLIQLRQVCQISGNRKKLKQPEKLRHQPRRGNCVPHVRRRNFSLHQFEEKGEDGSEDLPVAFNLLALTLFQKGAGEGRNCCQNADIRLDTHRRRNPRCPHLRIDEVRVPPKKPCQCEIGSPFGGGPYFVCLRTS
mmetsp:Transcript_21780/g.43290  ORF Transcript_21780/g.43290 Transcript_21780/m.43290 type:complete len:213 (-) Transcript_21780:430-1068(-)